MTTSEVLAVATAVVVALFVGALAMSLVALTRTLRVLRQTVDALREETLPLVAELRDATRAAGDEVELVVERDADHYGHLDPGDRLWRAVTKWLDRLA